MKKTFLCVLICTFSFGLFAQKRDSTVKYSFVNAHINVGMFQPQNSNDLTRRSLLGFCPSIQVGGLAKLQMSFNSANLFDTLAFFSGPSFGAVLDNSSKDANIFFQIDFSMHNVFSNKPSGAYSIGARVGTFLPVDNQGNKMHFHIGFNYYSGPDKIHDGLQYIYIGIGSAFFK